MKKQIVLLLTVLLLVAALAVPVFAQTQQNSFSEDLQTLYYQGEEYHRFDGSGIEYGGYHALPTSDIQLPEQIKDAQMWERHEEVLYVELTYTDGATLSAYYITQEGMAEIEALRAKTTCTVYLYTYSGCVTADVELTEENMERQVLYRLDYQSATDALVYLKHNELSLRKGAIWQLGDDYYYVDAEENQMDYVSIYNAPSTVIAWKITDGETCTKLDELYGEYYSSDIGILEDSNFAEKLAIVILVAVFILVPLPLAVLMLIIAIRAKEKIYRRLAIITGSCGLATVLATVVVMIVIMIK